MDAEKFNDIFLKITKPEFAGNYRTLYPKISIRDFYISTIGLFKNANMSDQDFDKIAGKKIVSKSFSEYKIYKNLIYRKSDHWGKVASCIWKIDNFDKTKFDHIVGVINVNDLKPNFESYKIGYIRNADKIINKQIKLLNTLKTASNSDQIKQIDDYIDWLMYHLQEYDKTKYK